MDQMTKTVENIFSELADGNYENILQFVYVLVEQNAQDTEVLNRVKSKLYVYGTSGNSKLLHSIAILCAFTDDQAGWNEIVEHLGEHMHPGLGYTVYIKSMRPRALFDRRRTRTGTLFTFSTAGENVRRRVVRNCCVVKMKLLFVVCCCGF